MTLQADELWSFVDNEGNKQWGWLALDAETCERVGVVYRQKRPRSRQAVVGIAAEGISAKWLVYTDFWEAAEAVIRSKRHRAVGKATGRTSYIEGCNGTVR